MHFAPRSAPANAREALLAVQVSMRISAHAALCVALCFPLLAQPLAAHGAGAGAASALPQAAAAEGAAAVLTPAQLENLVPATVYFRGKTAPVQMRNAAGARFGADGYVLAALVDTSGYASSVQETYQFYLITERALIIGGQRLPAGAYGAGVVKGKFLVMDVGGRMLLQADAAVDSAMPRPRPLQMVTGSDGGVRLYLGRQWVAIAEAR